MNPTNSPLMQSGKWPKVLPPLTPEQQQISDDFMKRWHEVLPRKYGVVETFNHHFPVRCSEPGFKTTLEIGAGLGEHIGYEKLSAEQEANYYALELRENMAAILRKDFPKVHTVVANCQEKLDFADGFFDRVIAVHVLEHLPDLPACIREMYRLVNKERGQLLIVIPCEGSPAYSFARRISAQRIFEKQYGQSYEWFYKREHINLPHEIIGELMPYFSIEKRSFFPIPLPFIWCNLCIGLSLSPRTSPLT